MEERYVNKLLLDVVVVVVVALYPGRSNVLSNPFRGCLEIVFFCFFYFIFSHAHSYNLLRYQFLRNESLYRSHLILGGHLRSLPTLLVNFQFPWGVLVLYFEVPSKLAPYLVDKNRPVDTTSLTTSEKTLAKWLVGDDAYKNDRLKLIPYVAEGPWVVRNMVTGRPALIGRKLPVSYRILPGDAAHHTAPLCECTLDIGSSSATAKRIVSVCRRYMSGLSADIGFVIQAESPAELPEQMMGSIRVHGPDPLKAPKI